MLLLLLLLLDRIHFKCKITIKSHLIFVRATIDRRAIEIKKIMIRTGISMMIEASKIVLCVRLQQKINGPSTDKTQMPWNKKSKTKSRSNRPVLQDGVVQHSFISLSFLYRFYPSAVLPIDGVCKNKCFALTKMKFISNKFHCEIDRKKNHTEQF